LDDVTKVAINAANLEHGHFYLRSVIERFPSDVIGGANKQSGASSQMTITLPFGPDVQTDIAGDKNIFRKRGWVKRLYEYRNAVPGDQIAIVWLTSHHISIDVENIRQQPAESAGQTIQILIDNISWLKRHKFEFPVETQGFFPSDALGARGIADRDVFPQRGHEVEFDYGGETTRCDIAARKSGAMRPRDNGSMRRFMESVNAALGDVISVTRTAERTYRVSLIKR
jgi:hypothetical protein